MVSTSYRKPLLGMLALAAVLALTIFVYPLTVGFPLLDPAEGLHAAIARDMVESGDWVTPRFLGKPFLDKPILYFWAEAASLQLFGVNETALRLPGLLLGLLGAATTAALAWRLFGRGVGLLAGMFYATTILPTALAQAAVHDVAMIPAINLALFALWRSRESIECFPEKRPASLMVNSVVLLGALMGLLMLTKGLVGVAVVGVAFGGYAVVTRQLSMALCLRAVAAAGLAVAIAAPWYVVMELRNPGYLHYFFIDRHVLGFTTDSQIHGGEPWWYYLPILLGGGLPWIAYLPATFLDQRARREAAATTHGNDPHGRPMLLMVCWLVGGVGFLSLAHSKTVTYLWPVFPPVAILAAVAWTRLIEGELSAAARRSLAWTFLPSSLAGPAVLAIAMLVVQRSFAVQLSPQVWTLTILVGLAAWLPPLFWMAGRCRAALAASLLATAAQFVAIMTLVLSQVAIAVSSRDLAEHFNRLGHLPERLLMAEERIGSLVFYLDANLRDGLDEGRIQHVKMSRFSQSGVEAGAVVAISDRAMKSVNRRIDLTGLPYEAVGHYRLYRATDLAPRLAARPAWNATAWQ